MIWVTLFFAGLFTFLIRLSFIWLFGRLQLPDWLMRALSYVPVAVLSAIIFPEIFSTAGDINFSLANPRLLAASLAVWVAWKTRSVTWVVITGMAALWILTIWID